jgi:hypothetical protein
LSGGVEFGLALMTDQSNPKHKYVSLKAKGSASLEGVDGLIVTADNLEVAINQGVVVPKKDKVETKANTRYKLSIGRETEGTVKLTVDSKNTYSINVSQSDTDEDLKRNISEVMKDADVNVSGSRSNGFEIEFVGNYVGRDVLLDVKTTASDVKTSVDEVQAAKAGVNEVKLILIETSRANPPEVTSSVKTVQEHVAEGNERKALIFPNPDSTGRYWLTLTNGVPEFESHPNVQFYSEETTLQGNREQNIKGIQTAFYEILKGTHSGLVADHIKVSHDPTYKKGDRYDIIFEGVLAGVDIEKMWTRSKLQADWTTLWKREKVVPFRLKLASGPHLFNIYPG